MRAKNDVSHSTSQLTRVSEVGAAFAWRVKEPSVVATATDFIVVSFAPTVAITTLSAVTRELVTVRLEDPAAKFTEPERWLIV
jgi:hypothetical protein